MLQLMYQFDGLAGLSGVVDPSDDPETARQKMQPRIGAVYMVNMQMSFLSPPFGYSLFYLQSVAPPLITMGIISRSALPFLALQELDRKSKRLNSSTYSASRMPSSV